MFLYVKPQAMGSTRYYHSSFTLIPTEENVSGSEGGITCYSNPWPNPVTSILGVASSEAVRATLKYL